MSMELSILCHPSIKCYHNVSVIYLSMYTAGLCYNEDTIDHMLSFR